MNLAQNTVWVVSELFYPEETSTGYFVTRIAEGFAEGYPVSVLCSQPTYSARGRSAPATEEHNGVSIWRCWSTVFDKDAFLGRVINIVTISFSIFFSCLRHFKNGDIVFVVTNPPLLPLGVLLASRLRKNRCCLIIHDVYPEVLVATKTLKPSSFVFKAIERLTQYLYKRMAIIVVLGRDMAALVSRRMNSQHPPVAIIPNWGDVEYITPLERKDHPLLGELGICDKFVIQYSGNIGRTHGLEQILSCAERLKGDLSIHFLFIGFGGKALWVKQERTQRGLFNVTTMDYRPRNELPLSLTACDVAIISFVPGMAGVSVPSRMYNVMAAGKPIIAVADCDSELAYVVKEEGIGWVVQPGDVDGLELTIRESQNSPERLGRMGRRARLAAEQKYSFEKIKNAYNSMVAKLLQDRA